MEEIVHRLAAIILLFAITGCAEVGQESPRGDYNPRDPVVALWQLAEQGDAIAQHNLGFMYYNGDGVPKDDEQAVLWFRRAAKQGLAEAQFNLGLMYTKGEGVPQDDRKFVLWCRRAAEQGYDLAQLFLGFAYANGKGVLKDDQQAIFWYRKAAKQGDAMAQFNLGFMYANGEGIPGDDRQAILWYRKAAKQGLARAQFNLGFAYANGKGVPEDDKQATIWYRKAAEQGLAEAQFNLGVRYTNGDGVPKDDRQAVLWYRKAAKQGLASAQLNLGAMYANGEGVPEDDVHAFAWFNLAAAQNHKKAVAAKDQMRQYMTSDQIAEAQRLSRDLAAEIESDQASERETPVPIPGKPEMRSGSGFIVGAGGNILTNHHVVEECSAVRVTHGSATHVAWIQTTDRVNDLALLTTSSVKGTTASFGSASRVRLGETVIAAGYPLQGLLSTDLHVTEGNVSALTGPGDDARLFQISAPLQAGNSGGPVFDGAGNVIGVAVSKLDAMHVSNLTGDLPQNVNFAIQGALVRRFLDIQGIDYKRRNSKTKLAPERLAERARKVTVAVYCWK